MNTWLPLHELEERFLPEEWKQQEEHARRTGHSGGDYFVLADFVRAVRGEQLPSVDVHYALDMTLPGLLSQISIAQGDGGWKCPIPEPGAQQRHLERSCRWSTLSSD